jgi:hypothetical protein
MTMLTRLSEHWPAASVPGDSSVQWILPGKDTLNSLHTCSCEDPVSCVFSSLQQVAILAHPNKDTSM